MLKVSSCTGLTRSSSRPEGGSDGGIALTHGRGVREGGFTWAIPSDPMLFLSVNGGTVVSSSCCHGKGSEFEVRILVESKKKIELILIILKINFENFKRQLYQSPQYYAVTYSIYTSTAPTTRYHTRHTGLCFLYSPCVCGGLLVSKLGWHSKGPRFECLYSRE